MPKYVSVFQLCANLCERRVKNSKRQDKPLHNFAFSVKINRRGETHEFQGYVEDQSGRTSGDRRL